MDRDYKNNDICDMPGHIKKCINEAWNQNEKLMVKTLIGETIDKAEKLFPNYNFELAKNRGSEEIFYDNLVNVITDTNGVIKGLTFG